MSTPYADPDRVGPEHEETPRVLVVDDDIAIGRALERTLSRAGIGDVVIESDSRMALRRQDARNYDAILLDLHMPEVDGFDLMSTFVEQIGDEDYAPILVLTGDDRIDVRERALESGAKDFVQKPFEPTEVIARLNNLIDTARMHRRLRSFNDELTRRVEERTADVVAAKLEVLDRLARAGEYRDDMTGKHAQRVGTLTGLLAREMGLDEETATNIERAAPLHDIGKIGVPDGILLKEGSLDDTELETIRRHTVIGAGILSGSGFALLQVAESIALTHHEHWNGDGYPEGLVGEDIPVEGRITAVADAFDSLTNDRPYRKATTIEEAMAEIVRCENAHFAPEVVKAVCALHERGVLTQIEGLTAKRQAERARPLDSDAEQAHDDTLQVLRTFQEMRSYERWAAVS